MIFLTGGTGFLGTALIDKFFELKPDAQLCLIVRANGDEEAALRVEKSCKKIIQKYGEGKFKKLVKVVSGDLTTPGLNLSNYNKDFLLENITSVYHNAANTNLGGSYEELSAINIFGTEQVLALSEQINLKNKNLNFYYVSTAYVAGDTDGIKTADNLNLNVRFRNAYEQSKAIAETKVREYKDHFNTVTYRPSIIVGDSKTGVTSAFNVLYIPARFIISGLLKVIPALPHAPFDVVPVDYVADSIVRAHGENVKSGSTFHLTSGIGRESSPNEILEILFSTAQSLGRKNLVTKPIFISPDKVHKALSSVSTLAHHVYQSTVFKHFEKIACERMPVFKQVFPLIPYMIDNPRFDNSETLNIFKGRLSQAPLFSSYADNIFKYCFQTEWGKNPAFSFATD